MKKGLGPAKWPETHYLSEELRDPDFGSYVTLTAPLFP
jgi:hypothetical protein